MTVPADELIVDGRAALRRGDVGSARDAFERALAAAPTGDAIEGMARAAYLDLDYPLAIEEWERAHAAHREAGDLMGAVRVARMLGYMHGTVVGDRALMSGWLARSRTLLADAPESLEGAWVTLDSARFAPDAAGQEQGLP